MKNNGKPVDDRTDDEDSWQRLYSHHADLYEQLVEHEDVDGNLLPALAEVVPFAGAKVVECGAGTGRISALLQPHVKHITALDFTSGMIRVANTKRQRLTVNNWSLVLADSRALPIQTGWADVAIEGWSFLGIALRHPQHWQAEMDRALAEMERVLRPGGTAVLIETLGTGKTSPEVPGEFRQVYDYLEQLWGFASSWIRTDYLFPSMAVAEAIVTPFFGPEMLATVQETAAGVRLPECTGIWWQARE